MAKDPDYGDTLDYGNGVKLPRPTDDPKSATPAEMDEEDFMEKPGPAGS